MSRPVLSDPAVETSWICGYAQNLVPCHRPAIWTVSRGDLTIGACSDAHKEAIKDSLIPAITVRYLRHE